MLSTTSVSAAPKINKKTATVYVNKTITLRINGAKRKVKWRSSNAKIASVNKNGVVRGKRAGKAKITLGPDCAGNGKAHPWHLIHTDSQSNVYGWVDEGTFD